MSVIGSLAGDVISGAFSYFGQKSANKANSALASRQMDFQREMSNTAYRRTMHDMSAAGLNPILAAKVGGASTPSGASAVMQNIGAGPGAAAGGATAKALGALALRAQTANVKEDTILKESQNRATNMQANKTIQENLNLQKVGKILDEDLSSAKKVATQSEMDEKLIKQNPVLRNLGTIMRELGITGNSAASTLRK